MKAATALLAALLSASACSEAEPVQPLPPAPTPSVVPTRLLISVSPTQLPARGGSAIVRVETTADGGFRVAPNIIVSLAVTSGQVSQSEVTTDATGHATVIWDVTQTSTMTARAGTLVATAALNVAP